MKRKNWRVNTEHSSRFGPSFHGVLGSKTLLNDSEAQENQGVGCNKRVRFRDIDGSKLQESDSVPLDRVQDTKSDEPKTSEYAIFKKLWEEALHARPLHHDKSQSINHKVSQRSRGKIDATHTQTVGERSMSHKNLKTLFPKDATPDYLSQHTSTPDFASAFDMKSVYTTSSDIHNRAENTEQYGAQCHNADVFSKKRHKLRQLAAKSLSLGVDELFSQGHDVVSVLVSKLFPENSRNKGFEDLKTRTSEMDTLSESFTFQKFDIRMNESQWAPARNFMELDYERTPPVLFTGDDMNLDIRKHQCLTSRHHIELDEFHYSVKPLNVQEPRPRLLGWDEDSIADESILSAVSKCKELILHPFLSSVHDDDQPKNIDYSFTENEFLYPIKSFHRQETPKLLLGWDVDSMVDENNLSSVSQNTELSLNCLLSSHYDDQEKNLDDSFTESTLCTDSLVSYHPPTSENTELSFNCFLPILCSDGQKKKLT